MYPGSDDFMCFIAGIALGFVIWGQGGHKEEPRPEPHTAAAYRAAQAAVENATGVPCDYACKVTLANMDASAGN